MINIVVSEEPHTKSLLFLFFNMQFLIFYTFRCIFSRLPFSLVFSLIRIFFVFINHVKSVFVFPFSVKYVSVSAVPSRFSNNLKKVLNETACCSVNAASMPHFVCGLSCHFPWVLFIIAKYGRCKMR